MPYDTTILLGAVAYDPKVVSIWEGIRVILMLRSTIRLCLLLQL